ncbi:hypothetical protein KAW44_07455, partial [Candidatus Bipolaricaulota bacterium]|nr:hypothetical protein [Candidatus Bipolaricaulota bacterium]
GIPRSLATGIINFKGFLYSFPASIDRARACHTHSESKTPDIMMDPMKRVKDTVQEVVAVPELQKRLFEKIGDLL